MKLWVLTQVDRDTKVERPVAVVTDQGRAEQFYSLDMRNHDYIGFDLDDVPMLTGKPYETPESEPIPPPSPHMEGLNNTTKNLQEANRLMQEMLKNIKRRK
jgi:hypothetical protein